MKEAMTTQDIDKLKQAIANGCGVLSDSELAHAKKLLDFLKISQGRIIVLTDVLLFILVQVNKNTPN